MATYKNYPIDLPILVIEAQIFVAVKKFPFLPNKQIPNVYYTVYLLYIYCVFIVYHVTSVSDQIRQHEAEAGEAAATAALLETRGHHHQNVLGQN